MRNRGKDRGLLTSRAGKLDSRAHGAGSMAVATYGSRIKGGGRWWRLTVGRLDLVIASVATLTTGAVALVLEDALPLPPGERVFDPIRWLCMALSLLVLLLAVRSRQLRSRTSGTLYYLRCLQEWMEDWRLDAFDKVKGSYRDRRVIGRWSSAVHEQGVLDLSIEVEALIEELQRSMNDDRSDTGFHIAPNMLLPAGVAVGFQLYRWDDLTFEELFGPTRSLSWKPGSACEWWRFDKPEISVTHLPDQSAGCVVVTAVLTSGGATTFPQVNAKKCYEVGVFPRGALGLAAPRPVEVTTKAMPGLPARFGGDETGVAVVHPEIATEALRVALRRALHENPDCVVVLAARLPKTVAVALGWALANDSKTRCETAGCKQMSCLHPWSRLVIGLQDQERDDGSYVMTRVHPSQLSAEQIRLSVWGSPVCS